MDQPKPDIRKTVQYQCTKRQRNATRRFLVRFVPQARTVQQKKHTESQEGGPKANENNFFPGPFFSGDHTADPRGLSDFSACPMRHGELVMLFREEYHSLSCTE